MNHYKVFSELGTRDNETIGHIFKAIHYRLSHYRYTVCGGVIQLRLLGVNNVSNFST